MGKPYAPGCIAGFMFDGNTKLETVSFEEWTALDPLAFDGMKFHVSHWRFLPSEILYTEARTDGRTWNMFRYYVPITPNEETAMRYTQALALFDSVRKADGAGK